MNEDIATVSDVELDVFDRMTDRELLLSIARDIASVKVLIGESLQTLGPILDKPMVKLALKTML